MCVPMTTLKVFSELTIKDESQIVRSLVALIIIHRSQCDSNTRPLTSNHQICSPVSNICVVLRSKIYFFSNSVKKLINCFLILEFHNL